MLRLSAFSALCATLIALPATAQVVGRHVFDVVGPQSSFTYSGQVTFAGLGGPIVGNPPNFNVTGEVSADLGLVAGGITTGQFVPGHGTVVTLPTLNAAVPNPIPFLPPLATIVVSGATVVFRSVDTTTGADRAFNVLANGSFSTGIVGDVLSGSAVISGLVNQTIPLAGISSSPPQTVTGSLSTGAGGVRLQVAIATVLNFSDPASGASGTLNLTGNIVADDRAFAGDVAAISSATGGTQVLRLSAGSNRANATYLVLGSVTGTTPGLTFGSVNLPLNFDGLMELGISQPNTFPYGSSFGTLDARGFATATFTLPSFQPPLNLQIHHAFATLNGATVTSASNPVPVALTN